jgi:hypothetical protein
MRHFPGETMSTEWHYSKNEQQYGPISSTDLKGLAEAGEIGPDDLVWNSSLTEWVPAQRVKGLVFATAPMAAAEVAPPAAIPVQASAAAPVMASPVLTYQSPADSQPVALTLRAIDLLSRTRLWVLVMAIVMFLWVAIMAILGVWMMFVLTVPSGRASGSTLTVGFVYIAMAAFLVAPPIYLTRYYAQIGNLKRLRRPVDLENALDAQRAYWKYLGILSLVIVGIYAIIFIVALLFGIFR